MLGGDSNFGAPVGVDQDSGSQGAGLDQGESGEREPVGEQLLAGAQHERIDGEPVLVNQVVLGQRSDQPGAPPHADLVRSDLGQRPQNEREEANRIERQQIKRSIGIQGTTPDPFRTTERP